MGTLCGWASIDENGKARGGTAGDQTGREVKTGNWYNFGQKVVLRFKDRKKAKKAAATMKTLCDGNYVGYDQNQRTTLYAAMKAVGFDASKLKTKCETDCSAMMSPVLASAGITVSKDIYTGNMVNALMNTGEFEKLTDAKYLLSGDYHLTGDISVNEGSHTIMTLEDGAKASGTTTTSASGTTAAVASTAKEPTKKASVKIEGAKSRDKALSGTYKVTASGLHLRAGAGTKKTSLLVMPKNAKVQCYGYYTTVDGVKWLYVMYGEQDGFASSKYLKK